MNFYLPVARVQDFPSYSDKNAERLWKSYKPFSLYTLIWANEGAQLIVHSKEL